MMATETKNKLGLNKMLFSVIVHSFFASYAVAFSSFHEQPDRTHVNVMRSVTPTKSTAPQARLHPGVIASVVFVMLAAIAAAVYIVRKYCFPTSNATYRYSILRQMEEQAAHREEQDSDDEPLLE